MINKTEYSQDKWASILSVITFIGALVLGIFIAIIGQLPVIRNESIGIGLVLLTGSVFLGLGGAVLVFFGVSLNRTIQASRRVKKLNNDLIAAWLALGFSFLIIIVIAIKYLGLT